MSGGEGTGAVPGGRCPNVVDDGDGPERCTGDLVAVGLWGGDDDDDGGDRDPDTWYWWWGCPLCRWDESIGGVP